MRKLSIKTTRELINSARELQQKILQADKLVSNEDIEFLERWLMEHILTADMRMGAYLAMEMQASVTRAS